MISVCICTHNPRWEILRRTFQVLAAQAPSPEPWELIVVDNGSREPLRASELSAAGITVPARVVREDHLGLSHARLRALREARGEVLLFVDDDNFLERDYVATVARFMERHPRVGAVGGRGRAVSDRPLPAWFDLVAGQLAVRDLGNEAFRLQGDAPCGAGMALRRAPLEKAFSWPLLLVDRQGAKLSSGGDTELCRRIELAGWELWYEPAMTLEHHLEGRRFEIEYLERLNEGFGQARPFMDLYASPRLRWRRIQSLRRARFERSESRRLAAAAAVEADERTRVDLCLRAAFSKGLAESLTLLAFGPAIWRDVARHVGGS